MDLPDWLKLEVADAVVLFGRIEQELIEIRWKLMNAGLEKRLELARTPTTENFLAIITAIEQCQSGLDFAALRKGIRTLADDRNLIVHGAWFLADGKPWVVWHKFLENTDSIIGEHFDRGRFERFSGIGRGIFIMLRDFNALLTFGEDEGSDPGS